MTSRKAMVIVVVAFVLLHEGLGRPEYEDCNRKVRRQIMESCSNPKGKRSVRYDDTPSHSLTKRNDFLTNARSSSLMGELLGVPAELLEDVHEDSRYRKRSPDSIRQLMLECCMDYCAPERFLGYC